MGVHDMCLFIAANVTGCVNLQLLVEQYSNYNFYQTYIFALICTYKDIERTLPKSSLEEQQVLE